MNGSLTSEVAAVIQAMLETYSSPNISLGGSVTNQTINLRQDTTNLCDLKAFGVSKN